MAATDPAETGSCAVVVTYNPDITALLKLVSQLNKETDFLVIDNGSASIDELAASITVYKRCIELVRLTENEGLAKALNRGISWAQSSGYDYVFLFDQDSSLCDLFIARMVEAHKDASRFSEKGIAAIGPRIINPQTMRQTPFKLFSKIFWRSDRSFANQEKHFIADFLITSGSLVSLKTIEEIGDMKESYFIDNVDLEWCFRAKSLGFDLVGTDAAVLYHAIGERSANPLVKAGLLAQHNPLRTYYSSRNRIHLYGASYSPLGWKLRDMIRFTLKASWLLISSGQRRQYFENIRSGIRDAKTLV
ncbi:MAG: rhamnosyltransferase [Pseudohongiella sp.]|nr:MAG: rhamnosyltransferase [Pseudohongiella sp.]